MTEVTLAKRSIILASITILAVGATACTREKPAEPTLVAQITTPLPTSPITLVPTSIATIPTTLETTTSPTDTPTTLPGLVSTPTATATQVTPATVTATLTASGNPGTYTVQWGDWLNKIAARFGVSPQAIIAANPGIDPNRIYPGQVLTIPGPGSPAPQTPPTAPSGPTTYTVQRGDWFYSIARKFGVSVSALQAANPGVNPNFVFPGQVLNIPGAGTPGTPPTPSSGGSYTVRQGDTLFSIALRFRTTTYALQIKNNLANPNFIYPGQVLLIP